MEDIQSQRLDQKHWLSSLVARYVVGLNLCLQIIANCLLLYQLLTLWSRWMLLVWCWYQNSWGYRAHTKDIDIIYRIIRVGVRLVGRKGYLTTHTPCYETLLKDVSIFWSLVFLYIEGWPRTLCKLRSPLFLLQLRCITIYQARSSEGLITWKIK